MRAKKKLKLGEAILKLHFNEFIVSLEKCSRKPVKIKIY